MVSVIIATLMMSLVTFVPLILLFAFGSQTAKFVFIRALNNPEKVKVKDKLLIKIVDDERIIQVIENVLIMKRYPVVTNDISRAMYSISPLIAKIYGNFIGAETNVAIKGANAMFEKYCKDLEEAKAGKELERLGIAANVAMPEIPKGQNIKNKSDD